MKSKLTLPILIAANLGLLILNLISGSVTIPLEQVADALFSAPIGDTTSPYRIILLESRLPNALTALLTGAALGTCGLILQSYFRNPLAGPSILGITNGANLAVAIVTLGMGPMLAASSWGGFGIVGTATIGALGTLMLLLAIGRIVRHPITLLIVGILLSYLSSALLTLFHYYASAEGVQSLMLWGMGDFSNVGLQHLPTFAVCICIGLLLAALLIKPLNGWMLGDQYALSAGIKLNYIRWMVLLSTGLLCAVTTAWCGPIAFVGLSVPHMARLLMRTDDHRILLPHTILLGALCTSLCLWLSTRPEGGHLLPINALTPVLGVPVILYVLLSRK